MYAHTVMILNIEYTLWWCRWLLLLWIAKMIEKCYRTILFGEIDCITKRRWKGKSRKTFHRHSIPNGTHYEKKLTRISMWVLGRTCFDGCDGDVMLSIADEYAQCVRIWGAHFKCLCLLFFFCDGDRYEYRVFRCCEWS